MMVSKSMYTSYRTFREELHLRTLWLWLGATMGVLTLFPIPVVLALAYLWRSSAYETRYHSHFRSIIRTLWRSLTVFAIGAALFLFDPAIAGTWMILATSLLCMVTIRGFLTAKKSEPFYLLSPLEWFGNRLSDEQ